MAHVHFHPGLRMHILGVAAEDQAADGLCVLWRKSPTSLSLALFFDRTGSMRVTSHYCKNYSLDS
jgi:hypothetical protein